ASVFDFEEVELESFSLCRLEETVQASDFLVYRSQVSSRTLLDVAHLGNERCLCDLPVRECLFCFWVVLPESGALHASVGRTCGHVRCAQVLQCGAAQKFTGWEVRRIGSGDSIELCNP